MALDVYFQSDVLGALRGAAHAHGPMGEEAAQLLEAVGLWFRISPEQIGIELRAEGVVYDTFSGPRQVDVPFLPRRLTDGRTTSGGRMR